MNCKDCHHTASCRFGSSGMQCFCGCHDVADAALDLLEACERALEFTRRALEANFPKDLGVSVSVDDHSMVKQLKATIAKAKG